MSPAGDAFSYFLSGRQLSPYSPDFNPIEMMFSKVKALVRGWGKRTAEELVQVRPPWNGFVTNALKHRLTAFQTSESGMPLVQTQICNISESIHDNSNS